MSKAIVREITEDELKSTVLKAGESLAIVAENKGGWASAADTPANEIRARAERFADIQAIVKNSLVDGVDFGVITAANGTTTLPTLFIGGAQKVQYLFGLSVTYSIEERWEKADLEENGLPFFGYRIQCNVYDSNGTFIGEAQGMATTKENKFNKMGAFAAANNVLKIAYKRAYVSAIRNACGLANMFTVDLEDNDIINKQKVDKRGGADGKVTRAQIKDICARFGVWGLSAEEQKSILATYGATDIKELPTDKVSAVLATGREIFESKKQGGAKKDD